MKQTAVEWLINWVNTNQYVISNELLETFEKAKAMEKEQIVNAYKSGDLMEGRANLSDAEQYYNETYNK
jgi:hypothetical protein